MQNAWASDGPALSQGHLCLHATWGTIAIPLSPFDFKQEESPSKEVGAAGGPPAGHATSPLQKPSPALPDEARRPGSLALGSTVAHEAAAPDSSIPYKAPVCGLAGPLPADTPGCSG